MNLNNAEIKIFDEKKESTKMIEAKTEKLNRILETSKLKCKLKI